VNDHRAKSQADLESEISVRWNYDAMSEIINIRVQVGEHKAIILELPEQGLYPHVPRALPYRTFVRGCLGEQVHNGREDQSLAQAIELMREATYLLDAAEVPEVRDAIHGFIRELTQSLKPKGDQE